MAAINAAGGASAASAASGDSGKSYGDASVARVVAEQMNTEVEAIVSDEVEYVEQAAINQEGIAVAEAAVQELVGTYGEDVAVTVQFIDGSAGFEINGDTEFSSASMIKLLVLAEYLDEVDSGELSSTDTYALAADDVVGGSGSMQDDELGTEYKLDEVARRMIYQSDNVGTNVLIDLMGFDAINEKATELGLEHTVLGHKLMISGPGPYNTISANDAACILTSVANKTLASKERCNQATVWLLEQEDNEGLAEGLPEGVRLGHKTGTVDYIRHDGGIVYAEEPYTIVVMTSEMGYDSANDLIEQVSAAVYEALA